MSNKKNLPGEMIEEEWRGQDEPEVAERLPADPAPARMNGRIFSAKRSRQRIEEYFERKRLAEVLQEDLRDDIFRM
jgi:hypothetical protein